MSQVGAGKGEERRGGKGRGKDGLLSLMLGQVSEERRERGQTRPSHCPPKRKNNKQLLRSKNDKIKYFLQPKE